MLSALYLIACNVASATDRNQLYFALLNELFTQFVWHCNSQPLNVVINPCRNILLFADYLRFNLQHVCCPEHHLFWTLCCRLEKTGKTGKTVDAYQVAPPLCWLLWRSVYGNLQWSPCSSGRSPQIWENYKYHPARPCSACLTQSMLWTRPCSGHVALNKEICQIICGSISNKQKIVSVKNGMRTEHSHRINSELNIHTEFTQNRTFMQFSKPLIRTEIKAPHVTSESHKWTF